MSKWLFFLIMLTLALTVNLLSSETSVEAAQNAASTWEPQIAIVWPHDGQGNSTSVTEASQVNISIWPRNEVSCTEQPTNVSLYMGNNNTSAVEVRNEGEFVLHTVDDVTFPVLEFNNLPVETAQNRSTQHRFYAVVDGQYSNVWVHAADARTYYPVLTEPNGYATDNPDDALIQIVFPHDAQSNFASVDQATFVNVAVDLFDLTDNQQLSAPTVHSQDLKLLVAEGNQSLRESSISAMQTSYVLNNNSYPRWVFNDVPVQPSQQTHFVIANAGTSSIWTHAVDARTILPSSSAPPPCVGDTSSQPDDSTDGDSSSSDTTSERRIVFVSDRDGNQEIYVMNSDGSGITRLTNNPANDTEPAWSPDGTRITFVSDRDGNKEIYVMNADGSGATPLTTNSSNDQSPSWSPDGTHIVFVSNRTVYDDCFVDCHDIYVMKADGSEQKNITNGSANVERPAWSPDGTRILFVSSPIQCLEFCQTTIGIVNRDGSGLTNLTDIVNYSCCSFYDPAWSPDGTQIAFVSDHDGSGGSCGYGRPCISTIYVANADGSEGIRLADGFFPTWSPDGSKIAFISDSTIYLINANKSNEATRLADGSSPTWSPDGSKIAFISESDDSSGIHLMNVDGNDVIYLTDGFSPAWSPQ